MRWVYKGMAALAMPIVLAGCQSAGQHMADVQSGMTGQNISVGKVQREIRVGMTSVEVAETLGSPNIVTTDEQRRSGFTTRSPLTEPIRQAPEG